MSVTTITCALLRSERGSFVMRAMAKIVLTLAALIIAWRPGEALSQPCMKYNNEVSDCTPTGDHLANPEWCNGFFLLPLSPADEEVLLSRRYADSTEEVCLEWYQYGHPTTPDLLKTMLVAPDGVRCWLEPTPANGGNETWDGEISDVFFPEPVTRETCCDANVEGPHKEDTTGPDVWYEQPGGDLTEVFERAPVRGGRFTQLYLGDGTTVYPPQRALVIAPNRLKGTKYQYASDLLREGAEELLKFEYFGGSLDGRPWRRYPYGPQVDHIIPRVDKSGCPCGTNSFKNAHVISAKLNVELSNNCSDPRRKAIIDFYTVPPMGLSAPIVLDTDSPFDVSKLLAHISQRISALAGWIAL